MMRLVGVDTQNGNRVYHFHDREMKDKWVKDQAIIARSIQCGSRFTDAILGILWESENESTTRKVKP